MRWAQDVQTGSGRPWRDSFLFHLENSRKSLMKGNGKKKKILITLAIMF